MEPWLQYAMDYVPDWLGFQMRASEQPGCVIAVAWTARWFSNLRSAARISIPARH